MLEKIKYKSTEKLKDQYIASPADAMYAINPEVFNMTVAEVRQKEASEYTFKMNYQEHLKRLRESRKAIQNNDIDSKSVDGFFTKINKGNIEFTQEQMSIAHNSKEDFKNVLQIGLIRNHLLILDCVPEVRLFLGDEKMWELLNNAKKSNPDMYISFVRSFLQYVGNDETAQKVVLDLANEFPEKKIILNHFGEWKIGKLFEKNIDKLKPAAKVELQHIYMRDLLGLGVYVFEGYEHYGLLTKDEICTVAEIVYQDDPHLAFLIKHHKFFSVDFHEEQIQNTISELSVATSPDNLDAVFTYPYLTQDNRVTILTQRYNKYPESLLFFLEKCREYFGDDGINTLIAGLLETNPSAVMGRFIELIKTDYIDEENKQKCVALILSDKDFSHRVMLHLKLILNFISKDKHNEVIEALLSGMNENALLDTLSIWLPFLDLDDASVKELIIGYIKNSNNFHFVKCYLETESIFDSQQQSIESGNIVRRLLSKLEIQDLVEEQLLLGETDFFSDIQNFFTLFTGDTQKIKELVLRVGMSAPNQFFKNISAVSYLFTTDEIENFISSLCNMKSGAESAIDSIKSWPKFNGISQKFVADIIFRFGSDYPKAVFDNLATCLTYIPDEKRQDFVVQLSRSNPITTLIKIISDSDLQKILPNLGQHIVVGEALAANDMRFAPRALTKLWKKIENVLDVPDYYIEQEQTLVRLYRCYDSIAIIKKSDLANEFSPLKASVGGDEYEFLNLFTALSLLNIQGLVSVEEVNSLKTCDDCNRLIFDKLCDIFEIPYLEPGQMTNFSKQITDVVPTIIYTTQYSSSPKHIDSLRNIFMSIVNGTYPDTKFGIAAHVSAESALLKLTKNSLLPERLTLDQFNIWRADGIDTYTENLNSTPIEVFTKLQSYLAQNIDHIPMPYWEIIVQNGVEQDEIVQSLKEKLKENGSETHSLLNTKFKQKLITYASTLENDDEYNQLKLLESQYAELERQKTQLQCELAIATILLTDFNEIEPKDAKESAAKLQPKMNQLLRILPSLVDPADTFVVTELSKIAGELTSTSKSATKLTCSDTSDPQITLEIGEKPVQSCQSYNYGQFNQCLLGYFDPNSKILCVKNHNGSIIARAILRLLPDNDGNPHIHLERIYTVSASQNIPKIMIDQALKKANQMGIPLLVSASSQNELGIEQKTEVGSNISLTQYRKTLISKHSQAPSVYVDSAGGVRPRGRYQMRNLMVVERVINGYTDL